MVTVAIPTLAADDAFVECLRALQQQTFRDFQIVVVDNSGRKLVNRSGAAELAGARVMEMARNVGFGAAVNAAWEGCGSAYVAALNDDALASPGWLAALVYAGTRHPECGMFASCVLLAESGLVDSAGMLLCADGSSKQRGHGEPDARYGREEDVLLPSGSAALYRTAMLAQIGAFDADFFLYCEDTDLGLRARRAGWNCLYVPEARVAHRYSHSAGRVSALKAYYVERNRLYLLVKNFPLSLLLAAPVLALVRYAWHVWFLLRGTGAAAHFAAESGAGWRLPWFVLKAHFALLTALPRLLRQRRAIRAMAHVSDAAFRVFLRSHSLSVRKMAQY